MSAADIGAGIIAADKVGNWRVLHSDYTTEDASGIGGANAFTAYNDLPIVPGYIHLSDGYMLTPNVPAPTGSFSIVTKLRVSLLAGAFKAIFSNWSGSGDYNFVLSAVAGNLEIDVMGVTGATQTLTGAPPLNTFVPLAITYNAGSGLLTFYCNGVVTTATVAGAGVRALSARPQTVGAGSAGTLRWSPPDFCDSYGFFYTETELSSARVSAILTGSTSAVRTAIAKPKIFWPLVIDGTNDTIKANDGSSTWSVIIAHATYTTPASLSAAIQTAFQTHFAGMVVTITDGIFSFVWTGPWTLKCLTAGFTALTVIGCFATVDKASSNSTVLGDICHQNGWYNSHAVDTDSLNIQDRSMNIVTRAVTGQVKYIVEATLVSRMLVFSYLEPERTYLIYEKNSDPRSLERVWRDAYQKFEYFPDASDDVTHYTLQLDLETTRKYAPVRMYRNKALYTVTFNVWLFVA